MNTEFHADTIQVFSIFSKWCPRRKKLMTFEAPLPEDFKDALKLLRMS
jgi:hypothetical protein